MKKQYWIITVYVLLIFIGIPWYWPEDTNYIVMGFPLWVLISIFVSIGASFFTAFILLRYAWVNDTDVNE